MAFYQSEFGAKRAKPTRLLLATHMPLPEFVFEGEPTYDVNGYYTGPFRTHGRLECANGLRSALATCAPPAATEPAAKGEIAQQPARDPPLASPSRTDPSATNVDSGTVLPAETPALGYVTNKPEGTRLQGGSGRPRICYQMDGPRDFHDGGGLCSPGRWARERREHAAGEPWEWLRDKIREIVIKRIGSEEELEKEAFRMAEGGEEGCRLARERELQKEILELLKTWIEGQDLSEPGLLEIPEGQPLRYVSYVLS